MIALKSMFEVFIKFNFVNSKRKKGQYQWIRQYTDTVSIVLLTVIHNVKTFSLCFTNYYSSLLPICEQHNSFKPWRQLGNFEVEFISIGVRKTISYFETVERGGIDVKEVTNVFLLVQCFCICHEYESTQHSSTCKYSSRLTNSGEKQQVSSFHLSFFVYWTLANK